MHLKACPSTGASDFHVVHFVSSSYVKQMPDVPVEVIHAFSRKLGIIASLGQDEPALDDRLHVSREALWSPIVRDATLLSRVRDVGLECGRVAEDAAAAGIANVRGARVDLLRHGSHETGEFREVASDDRLAKGNIGENTIQRVDRIVIRRCLEKARRRLGPEVGRRDPQGVLAREVMEERTLGDIGCPAEIVDRCGGEAFRADYVLRRFEKTGSCAAAFWRM